jgi:penicillin-binding protein 1C
MQVVRLLWPGPRTLSKKASEAVWALRLERALSKDEILEQYINRAPFGNQLYGAEAAALRYFGKGAQELSAAQAAFLAALPQSPSHYNPLRDLSRAQRRQRWILERMRALGHLTDAQHADALAEPIRLQPPGAAFAAPHMMDYIRARIPSALWARVAEVELTLDHQVQALAEGIVRTHVSALRERGVSQAAVVVLDTERAEVLAMVGSRDFFDEASSGQVNGAAALRQPGSALKPFTYALAFERGWTPATLIADIPTTYKTTHGTYAPGNFDQTFRGPVLARPALASSLNIPAIKALEHIGPDTLLQWLRGVGFGSLTEPADYYGLALTLGAGEVRLLDLAAAYALFGRGGQWRAPTLVRRMADARGEPIPLEALAGTGLGGEAPRQVLDPSTAALIADILHDPAARASTFGLYGPLNLPFWSAAKTGTSSDARDIWVVGFTTRYVVGVWVGNFDASPTLALSGITGAAPIYRDLMLNLHPPDKPPPPPLRQPPNVTQATICALSGALATPDCPAKRLEVFSTGRDPQARLSAPAPHPPPALGEVPTAACDLHRAVWVDSRDGALVPEACLLRHPAPEAVTRQVLAYLPPAYDGWLKATGQPQPPTETSRACGGFGADARGQTAQTTQAAQAAQAASGQGTRITRPADRAVFQVDPALPLAQQRLRLEVMAPASAAQVRWLVDGEEVAVVARPFAAHWPLAVGAHTLTAQAVRPSANTRSGLRSCPEQGAEWGRSAGGDRLVRGARSQYNTRRRRAWGTGGGALALTLTLTLARGC